MFEPTEEMGRPGPLGGGGLPGRPSMAKPAAEEDGLVKTDATHEEDTIDLLSNAEPKNPYENFNTISGTDLNVNQATTTSDGGEKPGASMNTFTHFKTVESQGAADHQQPENDFIDIDPS